MLACFVFTSFYSAFAFTFAFMTGKRLRLIGLSTEKIAIRSFYYPFKTFRGQKPFLNHCVTAPLGDKMTVTMGQNDCD